MSNDQVIPPLSEPLQPRIVPIAGGLAVAHNMLCPVCRKNKAVYSVNRDVFEPCWSCQREGWSTAYKKPAFFRDGWLRRILGR